MDNIYKLEKLDDGTLIYKPIDKNYIITTLDDGCLLLQPIDIELNLDFNKLSILDLKNYDFTYSKINSCFIYNKQLTNLKYKHIYEHIYYLINDGTKIIKNTSLNIKTYNNNEDGWNYLNTLGISIQGVDANKAIFEIVNQSIKNNIKIDIKIDIKIELSNKKLINISF